MGTHKPPKNLQNLAEHRDWDEMGPTWVPAVPWEHKCHGIIESSRWEETFRTTQSNCPPVWGDTREGQDPEAVGAGAPGKVPAFGDAVPSEPVLGVS